MELKKAIEVLKERSEWIKKHLPESSHAKAIDTVVAELENPTYTPADMEAFWRWAYKTGWYYSEFTEGWYNPKQTDNTKHTIEEVLKIWEESK